MTLHSSLQGQTSSSCWTDFSECVIVIVIVIVGDEVEKVIVSDVRVWLVCPSGADRAAAKQ